MAINIKNLEERIQKKVHLVDSNTSVDDLTDMVEAALLLTGSLKTYADSSELPTATSSNEKIGFIQDIKAIKFNNGKEWVGMASGEVAAPSGPGVAAATHGRQGISFGYFTGGGPPYTNQIEKFSFTVDGNGTDVGDLTQARGYVSGNSSTTHGYTTGGLSGFFNIIDNFPFSVDTNASDVGDLTVARYGHGGASSDDHGYSHGGEQPPSGGYNVIDKYTFASNANATDVGDITPGHGLYVNGNNSSTDGYAVGGYQPSAPSGFKNNISKYSFTSDGNTTDAGDMTAAAQGWSATAVSSTTHGYRHGYTPPASNVIEKFEFASDGNATDVGDLTQTRYNTSGASSTTFGYAAGGQNPAPFLHDRIDKWPFASDTNAATVGNLTTSKKFGAGAQV